MDKSSSSSCLNFSTNRCMVMQSCKYSFNTFKCLLHEKNIYIWVNLSSFPLCTELIILHANETIQNQRICTAGNVIPSKCWGELLNEYGIAVCSTWKSQNILRIQRIESMINSTQYWLIGLSGLRDNTRFIILKNYTFRGKIKSVKLYIWISTISLWCAMYTKRK